MPTPRCRRQLLVAACVGAGVVLSAVERPILRLQQLSGFPQSWLIESISPHQRGYDHTNITAKLQAQLSAWARQMPAGTSYAGVGDAIGKGQLEDYIIYGPTRFVQLPASLRAATVQHMQPLLEEFCACELDPHAVIHGLRVYGAGAVLAPHLDWVDNWVISASICVSRNASLPPWPVELQGRGIRGTAHVSLNEGEALMYEGSRLWHSRPTPLNGGEYTGLFIGFVPTGYPAHSGFATRTIVWLVRGVKATLVHLLA